MINPLATQKQQQAIFSQKGIKLPRKSLLPILRCSLWNLFKEKQVFKIDCDASYTIKNQDIASLYFWKNDKQIWYGARKSFYNFRF